ncbi:RNA 3'-terminal phosphate cyclase domain-containing protein, partial [Infundibulicybe gibba]
MPGQYTADSVTAGSTSLLLQIAFPLFLFSPSASTSTLTLLGGTNATGAPQIDYARNIFLPFVKRHFGVHNGTSIDIQRRGYFPKGGGRVLASIPPHATPHKLKSISLLEGGVVKSIGGIAHSAWASNNVCNGMIRGARGVLAEVGYDGAGEVPVEIEYRREGREDADCQGSGIVLWAELDGGGMVGGSALGRKGASPVQVGKEAAIELVKGIEGGGAVDEWLQDQIIILMSLAEGKSEVRCWKYGLSLHTRTAIWVAEQLTDAKFEIDESSSHTIIRCHGIGY